MSSTEQNLKENYSFDKILTNEENVWNFLQNFSSPSRSRNEVWSWKNVIRTMAIWPVRGIGKWLDQQLLFSFRKKIRSNYQRFYSWNSREKFSVLWIENRSNYQHFYTWNSREKFSVLWIENFESNSTAVLSSTYRTSHFSLDVHLVVFTKWCIFGVFST